MGLFNSLKKINKKLMGDSVGSKVSNIGQEMTNGLTKPGSRKVADFIINAHTYGLGKNDKYSLLGQYSAGQDAKKAAEAKAKQQEQAQLDLLNAQETAAANALKDLSLKNTPDVVAGGTADALLGINKKRKNAGIASTISTSLGL